LIATHWPYSTATRHTSSERRKKHEALPDVLERRELALLLAMVERGDVWERHFPGRASATGCCSPSSSLRAFAAASCY